MILPVEAALERVPRSFIEASADLGARPRETFRNVILPLAIPGVAAGSIFTFSLTLGDYIIPGRSSAIRRACSSARPSMQQQGTAGNIPLAAAFTMVPIVIMGFYLTGAPNAGWGPSMRSGACVQRDRDRLEGTVMADASGAARRLVL